MYVYTTYRESRELILMFANVGTYILRYTIHGLIHIVMPGGVESNRNDIGITAAHVLSSEVFACLSAISIQD